MAGMLTQEQFDTLVENYNDDYAFLLKRASQQHYECLISSFTVLRDLHNVIMVLHETENLRFRVQPYPLSFRNNDALLKQLDFDGDEINSIYGFLEYVNLHQGMEFEDCLQTGGHIECRSANYERSKV
jgi:hypothetical protein